MLETPTQAMQAEIPVYILVLFETPTQASKAMRTNAILRLYIPIDFLQNKPRVCVRVRAHGVNSVIEKKGRVKTIDNLLCTSTINSKTSG